MTGIDLGNLTTTGTAQDASGGAVGAATSPKSMALGAAEDAQKFAGAIARAGARVKPEQTPEQKARSAAEQFVATALIQPILKQMRESNHTPAPFGPSQGEKQFQGLYDQEIAQRMTHAAHFPLVDRLAHDLMKKQSARKAGQTTGQKPAKASSVEFTG